MKKLLLLSLLVLFGCAKEASEPEIPRYSLTVTANPPEGGLVNPQTGTYNAGQSVNIVASANDFFAFSNWTGNWNGTENSFSITMDSNKAITGNFDKIDLDEDGVLNDKDNCPNTSSGSEVDLNGCSLGQKDTDGDGYTDDIDLCPGEGGNVNSNGCPDTDGDGIPNNIDQCKSQYINNEYASVDENGCKINYVSSQLITDEYPYVDYTLVAADDAEIGQTDSLCYADCEGLSQTSQILYFRGEKIVKVVDKQELISILQNGANPGFIPVTSKITDFSDVFRDVEITPFVYEVIRYMDVSNAITFKNMFWRSYIDWSQFYDNWNDYYGDSYLGGTFGAKAFEYWDTSNVTNMSGMFQGASFADSNGSLSLYLSFFDTSKVEDMSLMFYQFESFNYEDPNNPTYRDLTCQDSYSPLVDSSGLNHCVNGQDFGHSNMKLILGWDDYEAGWDVSEVKDFSEMFSGYYGFTESIKQWDTSSATDMSYMFFGSRISENLSNWNTNSVLDCQKFALAAEMGSGLVSFQGTYYKYYSHTTTIQTSDGQVLNFMQNLRFGNLLMVGGPYAYDADVMLPNFTNCSPD
jgi:hypothetical protein